MEPQGAPKKRAPRQNAKVNAILDTGKRKEAIARIKLTVDKGSITVNDKPVEVYFAGPTAKVSYLKPFVVLGLEPENYTISIKLTGGGKSGQLEAVASGIAKALLQLNPEYRPKLKKAKLLRRDPRVKERRKYGLAGKARADKQRPKR